MNDLISRLVNWLQSSYTLRLLVLGVLALLLLIPIAMIDGLVSDRLSRRGRAVAEVCGKWGGPQTLTGPALVVPYTHQSEDTLPDGRHTIRAETRHAVFLPQRLNVDAAIACQTRYRGIFSVPVYNLTATLEGEFERPNVVELGVDPASVDWDRVHLVMGVSDVRGIQDEAVLTWNEQPVSFVPGTGEFMDRSAGIHAPVQLDEARHFTFSLPLSVHGSVELYFVPFGKNTAVTLSAASGDPSFQGNWLPAERTIGPAGFSARWSIPFLGRDYPQSWTSTTAMRRPVEQSRFGVQLVNPVDHYRMAERSVKYAFLFILLTFTVVWLIELQAHLRVHPVQCLLLGAALCIFYLLELSLSEHLGFMLAYGIASAAVVVLITAYSVAAFQRLSRALLLAGGLILLYAYLYMLLMNEDYALLAGSIGLFAVLALVMFTTRRIDWYAAGSSRTPTSPST